MPPRRDLRETRKCLSERNDTNPVHLVLTRPAVEQVAIGHGIVLVEGPKPDQVATVVLLRALDFDSDETAFAVEHKVDLLSAPGTPEREGTAEVQAVVCGAEFLGNQRLNRGTVDVLDGVEWTTSRRYVPT